MAWVTVASFPDATLAHLARQRLATEGVLARLADEHTVSIDPLLGGAIGGVKLLVPPELEAQARALLALEEGEDDEELGADELRCPACESPYVRRRDDAALLATLARWRGGTDAGWRCERCEASFDAPVASAASYRLPASRVGDPVFRLARGRAAHGAALGVAAGLVGTALGQPALLYLLPLGFALLGHGLTHAVCSRPGCGAPLGGEATRCPRCGGVVAGSVRSHREHWRRRAAWKRGRELPDDAGTSAT